MSKKDAYYFSHDANARNDVKILRLRRQLGPEGYALYFMIIEILREQIDNKLPLASIPDLAYDFDASEEKVKAVVLGYELFVIDNETFFSARLLRSMEEYNQKKTKYVEAGRKGGQASVKQRLSNAQPLKERKAKEIKEKDTEVLPHTGGFSRSWEEWKLFRKEIKKPLAPTSISKQLEFLGSKDENTAVAIINQSIQNQWQGLFELNPSIKKPNTSDLTDGRKDLTQAS